MSDFIRSVEKFTKAVGQTTDQYNVAQTALYTALQLEEMAEKMQALSLYEIANYLSEQSKLFRKGEFNKSIDTANREQLLDADIDLAWVTFASAFSQGAAVRAATAEVIRANLDKITPEGVVFKDKYGKVQKPWDWEAPDLSYFVRRD